MTESEPIVQAISGDALHLTLRRPPLNFLDLALLRKFEACLDMQEDAPPCCALILEAEGNAFSAGLELSQRTREGAFLLLEQFHRVVKLLNAFPRPTIAVVRGLALGAGNELAACCDFVFASEKAIFGQPEIKVGSIPSLAPLVLPPLIGQRRTAEMILTGEAVPAKEAEKIGLISRALEETQLAPAVERLLTIFRTLSSPVLELGLKSTRQLRVRELEEHLRAAESLYLNQLMDLEDATEGISAFLEKRPPRWKNR